MVQFVLFAIFVLTKQAAANGTNGVPSSAQHFIKSLSLLRQPYGNYMKETFTSPFTVDNLPARFAGGKRALSANIYNLFAVDGDEGQSQGGFPLHNLQSDETWHYYAGDGPITLIEFDIESGAVNNVSLGISSSSVPQYTVKSRVWVGALLSEQTSWVLTGAQTTPGFDPRDSTMVADNTTLLQIFYERFPEHRKLLTRLTSF